MQKVLILYNLHFHSYLARILDIKNKLLQSMLPSEKNEEKYFAHESSELIIIKGSRPVHVVVILCVSVCLSSNSLGLTLL